MARQKVSERMKGMAAVASRFAAWKPATEVLDRVTAQPTIFPQFDVATRVGGWPLRRVGLVHGPSGHGKTAFVLGLGLSFLKANSFFAYVDAEYTTPEDWLQKLMQQQAANPGFVAMRPNDYEEVVVGVRELVNTIAKARNAGELDPGTSSLIVIDSLRKLVPANLLTKMLKGKDGMDGAKGRAAMMKAALNAQWLDELTPLLYHTNSTLVFIARESENPDPSVFAKSYKVGGGTAVLYDSSLGIRIVREGYVPLNAEPGSPMVGERHRVEIHKTKVGGREDKVVKCHFHTSNGYITPLGFDRARDVFEMGVEAGIIQQKGSWFSTDEGKLGQGAHTVVKALHNDQALLYSIEKQARDAALAAQKG
jgi:recombination protein RecA